MTAPQLHLPRTVASDQTERAVDLLQLYFKSRKFIGSQWDGFDPSGTRAASANVFTADDVASTALLNTPVPGHAVVHLLITQRVHFAGLLEAVGPDRDFIDVDPDPSGKDMAPVYELYEALKDLPTVADGARILAVAQSCTDARAEANRFTPDPARRETAPLGAVPADVA